MTFSENNSQHNEKENYKNLNYTQFPNVILDEYLSELGYAETKVLLIIVRKTFGFHKETDIISTSQIQKFTGLQKSNVLNGIKGLISKNIISRTLAGKNGKQTSSYRVIFKGLKIAGAKNKLEGCSKDTGIETKQGGIEITQGGGTAPIPTKENIKENIKEIKNIKKKERQAFSVTTQRVVTHFKNHLENLGIAKKNELLMSQEIERMMRIDNRSEEECIRVIDYLKRDSFWVKNILSVKKLRKHFDRLKLHIKDAECVSTQNQFKGFIREVNAILNENETITEFSTHVICSIKFKTTSKFYYNSKSFKEDVMKFFDLRN